MGHYDTLTDLFVIVKELVKDNQIAKAEAKIRDAEKELVDKATESDRSKVDELNITLFLLKRELGNLEAFILKMEESHNIDLSGFKTQLKQFNRHIEAIRREKKFISFR